MNYDLLVLIGYILVYMIFMSSIKRFYFLIILSLIAGVEGAYLTDYFTLPAGEVVWFQVVLVMIAIVGLSIGILKARKAYKRGMGLLEEL